MQTPARLLIQHDKATAPFDGPAGVKNPVRGLRCNMTRHGLLNARDLTTCFHPQHAVQALYTGQAGAEVRTATADRPLCMSRAA